MAKKSLSGKRARQVPAKGAKAKPSKPGSASKPRRPKKAAQAVSLTLAKAKALEKRDTAQAPMRLTAGSGHALRNSDFPQTYIKQIDVSLDDPDHWMTLTWAGPKAGSGEAGPFRTSPGAGAKGLNCDLTATSRRSGTKCTPKGTHTVEGFQQRLNSDARATFVTWFVRWRGIALHYFPSVPKYAASHGCVRIESKRVAQLVQDNSRIGVTKVVVGGTWTKPARQW